MFSLIDVIMKTIFVIIFLIYYQSLSFFSFIINVPQVLALFWNMNHLSPCHLFFHFLPKPNANIHDLS